MPRFLMLASHGETHMEHESRYCARFCSEQGLATGDPQKTFASILKDTREWEC